MTPKKKDKVGEKIKEMFNAFKSEEAMYQVISVVEYHISTLLSEQKKELIKELQKLKAKGGQDSGWLDAIDEVEKTVRG